MKTSKTMIVVVTAFFLTCFIASGQTVQIYTKVTVTNGMAWCLYKPLDGYIIYHLTYHLDQKTGFIDRMHANVHKAELWSGDTRYVYIDIGNDNSGMGWEWWNNPDNPGFDYDLEPGSIPIGPLPEKGVNVWATFKLIAKGGEKVSMHTFTKIGLNDDGTSVVLTYKENIDCNPVPEL